MCEGVHAAPIHILWVLVQLEIWRDKYHVSAYLAFSNPKKFHDLGHQFCGVGVGVQPGLVDGLHVPNLDQVSRLCIVLTVNYLGIIL